MYKTMGTQIKEATELAAELTKKNEALEAENEKIRKTVSRSRSLVTTARKATGRTEAHKTVRTPLMDEMEAILTQPARHAFWSEHKASIFREQQELAAAEKEAVTS